MNHLSHYKPTLYVSILCIFLFCDCVAQTKDSDKAAKEETDLIDKDSLESETLVLGEAMPRFPGCEEMEGSNNEKAKCAEAKMQAYIYSNLERREEVVNNKIDGQVVLAFTINIEGYVEHVEILRDPGHGLGEAAKGVILSMNNMEERWIPAIQKGKKVSVKYTLPIKFFKKKRSKRNK